MTEKIIDISNGNFSFSNDFELSYKTTPDNLALHFGQENLKIVDLHNGWTHYIIANAKKGDIYFRVTLYFENDSLAFLSFIVDDKLILAESWDNWNEENERRKTEYFDQWLTK